jgi:ribosome maturation factor RimP
MSVLDRQLLSHVERTVAGLGYVLVDLERAGGGLLRVTIERPDAVPRPGVMSDAGITVDDCERVSHQLTYLFAVENVDYERLEVGSPGVDRPLVKAQDFARFAGALVKVSLLAPVGGVRKLTGRIVGVEAEQVTVELIDPSELPEAKKQLPRSPSKRGAIKAESAPRKRVRFSVKDVDKARVVPELNFRSGRS